MEEILNNPWWSALVVLINQIIFIYFRTINVIFTAEKKVWASIISGNAIGIAWLISIAIGANAIIQMQWQPILAHLLGGSIGCYYGIKNKK